MAAPAKADPGHGPPPGSVGDGFPSIPLKTLADNATRAFTDAANDPAFAVPVSVIGEETKSRAKLVYRDLPAVTIQNTWSVEQARGALYAHMTGRFDTSGQLCDAVLGDDRVTATLNSRATALFGREVRFEPADDSKAAQEVCDAWVKWWPRFSGDAGLREMGDYSTLMGFSHAQLVWDTSGPIWGPYARPWHPRFTYYDWTARRFRAMSLDGDLQIEPGNGKWIEHCPFGSYRGWIRGALRAVTEPWMLRHFGFRDMARFAEVHGLPTRVGKVPAVSDPVERAAFESAIAMLGAETSMIIPQGIDGPEGGYEYDLVEATDTAWEVFPGQIDRCDMAIVLAILMVNLTTEVQGGSFAATKSHMDVRQGGTQADNQSFKSTLYNQVARPFAWINAGDADLAPWTFWDVTPREEYSANAEQFQKFGTAIEVMRRGGIQFKDPEQVRRWAALKFGLDKLPDFDIVQPVAGGGSK